MRWITRLIRPLILTVAVLSLGYAPGLHAIENGEIETISVLAEGPLAVPLSQIASRFSKGRMISVSNNFGSSDAQKKKIEDGESADLFITSEVDFIQQLKAKGLVDIYSISKIVRHDASVYTVAVVAGENMNAARVFLEYLKSDEAQALFAEHGFTQP